MRQNIDIKPDSLLLSGDRCFFSIQGEGDTIGKPAIFLRLHRCNLRCSFCDTPYTWKVLDPRYYSEPVRWSIEKTAKEIKKFPCKRLVITGGEPLLHRVAILELMYILGEDYNYEIETNGTFFPLNLTPLTEEKLEWLDIFKIQYNISPKLENSKNLKEARYRPETLKEFNKYNSFFKFVVVGLNDISEIEQIIKECKLDNNKIILMPEGITPEDVAKHGRAVTEICKEKNWRLIPRLHILLWGNERSK